MKSQSDRAIYHNSYVMAPQAMATSGGRAGGREETLAKALALRFSRGVRVTHVINAVAPGSAILRVSQHEPKILAQAISEA